MINTTCAFRYIGLLIDRSAATYVKILCLFIGTFNALAQDIPIGSWRTHLSYKDVSTLAITEEEVFAASSTGFFSIDRNTTSSTILSKADGFSDTEVTQLAYNAANKTLVIAYRSGAIDLLANTRITPINDIALSGVVADKQINHIFFSGTLAYLSTNFGVVVMDMERKEIKDTYRNLGTNGSTINVLASTIVENALFLATSQGILSAPLNGTNLLDFRNWRRFNPSDGIPVVPAVALASIGTQVYAALENEGLFVLNGNNWQKANFLQPTQINHLQASGDQLLVSVPGKVIRIDINNVAQEIIHPLLQNPQQSAYDENGKLWIADASNGLLSNYAGDFQSFIPGGPASSHTWNLLAYETNILALSGGYTTHLPALSLHNAFRS
jgi:hypothetical protein